MRKLNIKAYALTVRHQLGLGFETTPQSKLSAPVTVLNFFNLALRTGEHS
jgi:hypothetical protein